MPTGLESILSIDLGTSAVKVALFGLDGALVASASEALSLHVSKDTWAEQSATEWWQAVGAGVRKVVDRGCSERIRGLTLTGQMAGTVPIDVEAKPIGPALIWMDQRSGKEAEALELAFGGQEIYARTGCRVSAVYPAAKVLWFRNNEPDVFDSVQYFLSPKDYLVLRLTGAVATDPSTAGSTQMMSIAGETWDDAVIDFLGVDGRLPPIMPSDHVVGGLLAKVASEWGLPTGLPVVLGAGDGVCANVGSGAIGLGDLTVTIGTSGVVRAVAPAPLLDGRARITSYPFWRGLWLPNGAMNNAGASFDWIAQMLGWTKSELVVEARKVPVGSDNLLFLPYLQGERSPVWSENIAGAFVGIRLLHSRAHFARAVLEGVAYALRHILSVFEENGFSAGRAVLGGGGSRSGLVSQIIAAALGLPTHTSQFPGQETGLGAAIIGSIGLGLQPDLVSAVRDMVRLGEEVPVSKEDVEVYREGFGKFRCLSAMARTVSECVVQY